jgi:hypothetical protein
MGPYSVEEEVLCRRGYKLPLRPVPQAAEQGNAVDAFGPEPVRVPDAAAGLAQVNAVVRPPQRSQSKGQRVAPRSLLCSRYQQVRGSVCLCAAVPSANGAGDGSARVFSRLLEMLSMQCSHGSARSIRRAARWSSCSTPTCAPPPRDARGLIAEALDALRAAVAQAAAQYSGPTSPRGGDTAANAAAPEEQPLAGLRVLLVEFVRSSVWQRA